MIKRVAPNRTKPSTKSGFVYRPPSKQKIRDHAENKGTQYDTIFKPGFDVFKATVGTNVLRILPATWADADYYAYVIWIHRNIGPDRQTYLCPLKMKNKKCPICEMAKQMGDAGEDREEVRKFLPTNRFVCWCVDRGQRTSFPPVLWNMSYTQDQEIAAQLTDERSGDIIIADHPHKGHDISFKRKGTTMKNTEYFGYKVSRSPSPISSKESIQDKILDFINKNSIPSILNFYDYDHLKGLLSGSEEEVDEDLDEEDEEEEDKPRRPAKKKVTAKKKAKRQHDEDEEEEEQEELPFDEDEEEEAEEASEDEEEEESEDEEEEESEDEEEEVEEEEEEASEEEDEEVEDEEEVEEEEEEEPRPKRGKQKPRPTSRVAKKPIVKKRPRR